MPVIDLPTHATPPPEMGDRYMGWQVNFAEPVGEPALLPPTSVQWRVYKNPIALGIGGVAAVLLEFADPRIRSGVWDHSTYPVDPIGRARRTGLAAMLACYGPASAARSVIQNINRLHARVKGTTPDGQSYRAMDPVLLDWVAATASYGFLMAYDRFVLPVSAADKDRFFRDGAAIGEPFGAHNTPPSMAAFDAMTEQLLPGFEHHPIVIEFLDIIQSGRAAPGVPRFMHRALARASVSLLPSAVRDRLALGPEYDLGFLDRKLLQLAGRLAERRFDPKSAPAVASTRLGLPADYLWRKLGDRPALDTQTPATA